MSADINLLEPATRAMCQDFLQRCAMQTLAVRVTQTLRTIAEQDAYYAQGRTAPGKIVTQARGGQSAHNFGAAFDICFRGADPYPNDDALWNRVGAIGEETGLAWGGRWVHGTDRPHFENPHWKDLRMTPVADTQPKPSESPSA